MNLQKLFSKKTADPHCSAVVLAAGSAERMGQDKVFIDLAGTPVLVRSILPFQRSDRVDEIVVVTRQEKLAEVSELCKTWSLDKVSKVITGGASRTESALAGVSELEARSGLIAIHDAARPFFTEKMLLDLLAEAQKSMAAVPGIPCTDTIRIVDENGVIVQDTDRNRAVMIQTPQVFHADIIKGALSYAVSHGLSLTDDSSAARMMGVKVHTVPGDADNIKLTVPDDLVKGNAILRSRGEL
jgi:2-C-methyl-D-erythritol 4-phosphate cytidylyltransferase